VVRRWSRAADCRRSAEKVKTETPINIASSSELTETVISQLVALEEKIFERPMTAEDLIAECGGKKGLQILIAHHADELVGYKLGFEYYSDVFFSMSGGVVPRWRRKGIATALMVRQHDLAKNAGYSFIRTHTKNKYREMLLLNIRSGFQITGVYKSLKEVHLGVVLEKAL
jgi:predicted GNAT superfamily acetyltransferase